MKNFESLIRKTPIALLASIGALGVGGCGNTSIKTGERETTSITVENNQFAWSDDENEEKSLKCEGNDLLYFKNRQMAVDVHTTYLNDSACADGQLSTQEVENYMLTEVYKVDPEN